ncbi:DUF2628 domain-containing protein [Paenibacillus thalictri]|uniref:DUF2628 domain-containing protein n=1 Tax=Paenibacillus thalictri TaxID=2527873 RepID=A0A4Q9DEC4_9BACL|nr:DUF2628 domain-containing protein [Paenibacillus thalictri]TBL69839.1 DUF2628 domain-containing protein [Paenibacillus thalictri]
MYCPKCGKEVQNDDIFCRSCGNRIQVEANDISQSASSPNTNNNMNQASRYNQLSSEEQEFRTFIGRNADFYLKKWKLRDKGWNWAACFCGFLWLVYRKMYLNLLIVFLVHILLILIGLVIITYSSSEAISDLLRKFFPFAIFSISLFVIPLVMGFFGNRMYYSHAKGKIEHVKSKILNEAEREKRIRQQGGIGVVGLLLTVFITMVIVVLGEILDILEMLM